MMCTIGPHRFVPFAGLLNAIPRCGYVQDDSAEELRERLARGDLDVAIYGQEIDDRFDARRLYDERFVIGSVGHAFEAELRARQGARWAGYLNRSDCEYRAMPAGCGAKEAKVTTMFGPTATTGCRAWRCPVLASPSSEYAVPAGAVRAAIGRADSSVPSVVTVRAGPRAVGRRSCARSAFHG